MFNKKDKPIAFLWTSIVLLILLGCQQWATCEAQQIPQYRLLYEQQEEVDNSDIEQQGYTSSSATSINFGKNNFNKPLIEAVEFARDLTRQLEKTVDAAMAARTFGNNMAGSISSSIKDFRRKRLDGYREGLGSNSDNVVSPSPATTPIIPTAVAPTAPTPSYYSKSSSTTSKKLNTAPGSPPFKRNGHFNNGVFHRRHIEQIEIVDEDELQQQDVFVNNKPNNLNNHKQENIVTETMNYVNKVMFFVNNLLTLFIINMKLIITLLTTIGLILGSITAGYQRISVFWRQRDQLGAEEEKALLAAIEQKQLNATPNAFNLTEAIIVEDGRGNPIDVSASEMQQLNSIAYSLYAMSHATRSGKNGSNKPNDTLKWLISELESKRDVKKLDEQIEDAEILFENIIGEQDSETSTLSGLAHTCPNWAVILGDDMTYEQIRKVARPLDLIAVRSTGSHFAKVINFVQNKSRECSATTHVGHVITTDLIKVGNMKDGEIYILEAVIGGGLLPGNVDNVKDVFGAAINGVQIRSLKEIMEAEENQDVEFMWCPLKDEHRFKVDECVSKCSAKKCKLRQAIHNIYGTPYPNNIFKFFAGLLPFGVDNHVVSEESPMWWSALNYFLPRHMSDYTERKHDGSFFCSEMCIEVLISANLLPEELRPHARRFYPVDFILPPSNRSADGTGLPCQLYQKLHKIKPVYTKPAV